MFIEFTDVFVEGVGATRITVAIDAIEAIEKQPYSELSYVKLRDRDDLLTVTAPNYTALLGLLGGASLLRGDQGLG